MQNIIIEYIIDIEIILSFKPSFNKENEISRYIMFNKKALFLHELYYRS